MSNICKLSKDKEGKRVDQKLYWRMIGSMLYIMVSRMDIMFNVCMCARFQSNLRESHLIATKRIFRYLVRMQSIRLWYSRNSSLALTAYSGSDFAGCKLDSDV